MIGQTSHIRRIEQIKFEGDSPLFVESRWHHFCCEGYAACCSTNFFYFDLISNRALKQAWLAGFKEAQNRALDVEMKEILLSNNKWEHPWSSLSTNSLNIIACCYLEVNEDVNVVANDVLVNYVGHKSCSRDDKGVVMVTGTTSVTSAWCSMLLKI